MDAEKAFQIIRNSYEQRKGAPGVDWGYIMDSLIVVFATTRPDPSGTGDKWSCGVCGKDVPAEFRDKPMFSRPDPSEGELREILAKEMDKVGAVQGAKAIRDGDWAGAKGITAALAALRIAAGRGTGWQDIATAPKDGTSIMLYANGRQIGSWTAECPGSHSEGWIGVDDWIENPTHWQPLPPPPTRG